MWILSETFDTLNHNQLGTKLIAYGLHSNFSSFIRSYLTKRYHRWKIWAYCQPTFTCSWIPATKNLHQLPHDRILWIYLHRLYPELMIGIFTFLKSPCNIRNIRLLNSENPRSVCFGVYAIVFHANQLRLTLLIEIIEVLLHENFLQWK